MLSGRDLDIDQIINRELSLDFGIIWFMYSYSWCLIIIIHGIHVSPLTTFFKRGKS